jgi:uncharacterized membrane protein
MSRSQLLATAFAAAILSFSGSHASAASSEGMEKCRVVDENGRGMIKEHMADCASADGSSCAGSNAAGDPEAWIMVPQGECAKINQGDFSGVSDEIKNKIEMKDAAVAPAAPAAEAPATAN